MSLFENFDSLQFPRRLPRLNNDETNKTSAIINQQQKIQQQENFFEMNKNNGDSNLKLFSVDLERGDVDSKTFCPRSNRLDFVPSAPSTDNLFLSQLFGRSSSNLSQSKDECLIYDEVDFQRSFPYTNSDIFNNNTKNSQINRTGSNYQFIDENLRSYTQSPYKSIPVKTTENKNFPKQYGFLNNMDEDHINSDINEEDNQEEEIVNKLFNVNNVEKTSDNFKLNIHNDFNGKIDDGELINNSMHKINRPNTMFNNTSQNIIDFSRPTSVTSNEDANRYQQKNNFGPLENEQTVETKHSQNLQLFDKKPITEIPKKFRHFFKFNYFNGFQSKIFDDALYSDNPLVISAPTGSGKTVVFELAIIRLFLLKESKQISNYKIVYMAPIKALVSERFNDWKNKLTPLDLKCCELTGDTEVDDYSELANVQVILTTPEKWDFMTRRWRDNKSLVKLVKLFLIDEVHTINDDVRGATLEAVVNRMKTIHLIRCASDVNSMDSTDDNYPLRFIAISATIPNIEDLAEWLGKKNQPALYYKVDDSERPVPLYKIVLGFDKPNTQSAFKFDLLLNYKLAHIIKTYSEMKPTLIFCSTRKSVVQAALTLAKETKFLFKYLELQHLKKASQEFKDTKLGGLVSMGIAYHHAGLDVNDRKLAEELFSFGLLAVLISTSTLAMGVNLPAHLVIIKSTQYYFMGSFQEYTESQVLQMIGRAGRPQFDKSAVAVIMTQSETKSKYESLLNGTQLVESSFHLHLIEHLNAEIVLQTITDIVVALEWIKSSFLYIRMNKNPKHYDVGHDTNTEQVEKKLQELCLTNLNKLASLKLISMDEDCICLSSTESGRLMARYCVAFETMTNFSRLTGSETLEELFSVFCSSEEFKDITLRVNEKKILNDLNRNKNQITIRFPLNEKIKSNVMKVNCLLQTQLGCLPMHDFALQQDTNKIFRCALRISKCLVELLWNKPHFKALHNAIILSKCLKTKLWENSRYVSKQISGIGLITATALVNSGVTSFDSILKTNPRNLELMVNRQPPFGNTLHDNVKLLPVYDFKIVQNSLIRYNTAELSVSIKILNADYLKNKLSSNFSHTCVLLVGGSKNDILLKAKVKDLTILGCDEYTWIHKLVIQQTPDGDEIQGHLISQDWVGIDASVSFKPIFENVLEKNFLPINVNKNPLSNNNIKCNGNVKKTKCLENHKNEYDRILDDLKRKSEKVIVSPAIKRLKPSSTITSMFSYVKETPKFSIPNEQPGHNFENHIQSDLNSFFTKNQNNVNTPCHKTGLADLGSNSMQAKSKPRISSYIIESPMVMDPRSFDDSGNKQILGLIDMNKLDNMMGVIKTNKNRSELKEGQNSNYNYYLEEKNGTEIDKTDNFKPIFKRPIGFPFSNSHLKKNFLNLENSYNEANSYKFNDHKFNYLSNNLPNKVPSRNNLNSIENIDDNKYTDDFNSSIITDDEYNMVDVLDQTIEATNNQMVYAPNRSDSVPDLFKINQLTGNFDLIDEHSFFSNLYPEITEQKSDNSNTLNIEKSHNIESGKNYSSPKESNNKIEYSTSFFRKPVKANSIKSLFEGIFD